MAKPKHPPDQPMTLGNMRRLGVHWLVACGLGVGLALNSVEAGQLDPDVCSRPIDDLTSGFLASAALPGGQPVDALPRMARWERRKAVIGIFRDDSSPPPSNPLQRNVAVLKAMAVGTGPSWPFRFVTNLRDPGTDIELTFISRAAKEKLSLTLRDAVPSATHGGCRTYLKLIESDEVIGIITKSMIVVNDDVSDSELTECTSVSLVHSIGLIGWQKVANESGGIANYIEAAIFASTLYDMPAKSEATDVRRQLELARGLTCNARKLR